MVYTLSTNVSIAVTGTAVPLASSRTPARWVLVQALDNNGAEVYVGGVNPSAKSTSPVSASGRIGIKLLAGSTMLFPYSSTSSPYDLQHMWVNGTAGSAVSVTYLLA